MDKSLKVRQDLSLHIAALGSPSFLVLRQLWPVQSIRFPLYSEKLIFVMVQAVARKCKHLPSSAR